jgi:serine/threonine protein kinase, bacterial
MPLKNGEVFAGFVIQRFLGAGAMGEVYLVQHPRLPRLDALKVLPPALTANAEYRYRFNREADLASSLWHSNIVGIHDRGEFNGQLWISMDYVDGTDADRLVEESYPTGMPMHEVLEIVTAVADALDIAHQRGLLHRDVKPANILLAKAQGGRRRILLADFGIARQADEVSGFTGTNMTIGSVGYAAPEQLIGEPIDGRADQYGLAVTAFCLLTGTMPFRGSNPAVVISKQLTTPAPVLSERRPDLANLDRVLSVALAKDPNQRYPHCLDFAEALSRASRRPYVRGTVALADATRPMSAPSPPAPPGAQPDATEAPNLPPTGSDAPSAAATLRRPRPETTTPAPPGTTTPPVPVAVQRRWQTSSWFVAVSLVVIGVVLVGGLTVLAVVQSSKSSNTSTSTSTSTSTATTSAPSTSAQASGPNETIADYIKKNNIQETTIAHGTPGAPTIDLPVPEGWTRIPEGTDAPYGGIVFNTPTNPNDPPKIIATVEKLTGNVDRDKLLAVAPGEVKNLPGYSGDGGQDKLSGYPAYQLGGSYTKNGVTRMVAQKTVVIQSKDGIYVLQLRAEGPQADVDALKGATVVISQKTTITP